MIAILRRVAGRLHSEDQGSIAIIFAVGSISLFALVGLVVDGSGKVQTSQQAQIAATNAGRAAAGQLDPSATAAGEVPSINAAAAARAANTYLREAGVQGTVTITDGGTAITVDTTDTYRTRMLSIVGITELSVQGHDEIRLAHGIDSEMGGPQ